MEALIGHAGFEERKFEYNGHIHVYSHRAGPDNPLVSNFYHKHKYLVNLIICYKLVPINWPFKSLPHSNTQATRFDLVIK